MIVLRRAHRPGPRRRFARRVRRRLQQARRQGRADAKTEAAAQAGNDGAKIPGLATEKEQVSYMIGMDMGSSLEPVKDEIDLDTSAKALKRRWPARSC